MVKTKIVIWLHIYKTRWYYKDIIEDSKAFIEYSNNTDNIYKNIEEYNPNKKHKILLVFDDDLIADMLNNKKLNPIVTELFIRGRELNISFVFITQSYFAVPKKY